MVGINAWTHTATAGMNLHICGALQWRPVGTALEGTSDLACTLPELIASSLWIHIIRQDQHSNRRPASQQVVPCARDNLRAQFTLCASREHARFAGLGCLGSRDVSIQMRQQNCSLSPD